MNYSSVNLLPSSAPTPEVAGEYRAGHVVTVPWLDLETVSRAAAVSPSGSLKSHLTVAEPLDTQTAASEAPGRALYPQVYDDSSAPGCVRALIERSLEQADYALQAFDQGDLLGVSNKFSLIGIFLAEAFAATDFNDALASIVDYLRRAVLLSGGFEVSREQLNTLVSVLSSLGRLPLISLAEAASHRRSLAKSGWTGDDKRVRAILLDYLMQPDTDDNDSADKLKRLFDFLA